MGVDGRWCKVSDEGSGVLLELVRQLGREDGQALSFDRVLFLLVGAEVMGERSTLVLGLG